jgi:Mn2+/Fe2+ NRAMP family transporter
MLTPVFHSWATPLFALALGIGCFGAAVELSLNAGYILAQGFGWSWGANRQRLTTARFSVAMTLMLTTGTVIALLGFDPLQLTMISVGITVLLMPVVVLPMLVLMNDDALVKDHRSGPVGNAALAAIVILGAMLACVVIPLEIMGGG